MRRTRSMAVFALLTVLCSLLIWRSQTTEGSASVTSGRSGESRVDEVESHVGEVRQEPAQARVNADVATDPRSSSFTRASELVGKERLCFEIVNNTLQRAGDAPIPNHFAIAIDDIAFFEHAVSSDNDAIRASDKAIRGLQVTYIPQMVKTIEDCLAHGKEPPYENISGRSLPKSGHPYDLYVTTAHRGSTYLLTLPHSTEVMNMVDQLRGCESLRLANFRSVIKPLFKEVLK